MFDSLDVAFLALWPCCPTEPLDTLVDLEAEPANDDVAPAEGRGAPATAEARVAPPAPAAPVTVRPH